MSIAPIQNPSNALISSKPSVRAHKVSIVRVLQDGYHQWRHERLIAALRADLDPRALADIGIGKPQGILDWLLHRAPYSLPKSVDDAASAPTVTQDTDS